jgi:hypothetical protein
MMRWYFGNVNVVCRACTEKGADGEARLKRLLIGSRRVSAKLVDVRDSFCCSTAMNDSTSLAIKVSVSATKADVSTGRSIARRARHERGFVQAGGQAYHFLGHSRPRSRTKAAYASPHVLDGV